MQATNESHHEKCAHKSNSYNIVISHGDIDNFALSVVVVYCDGKNAIYEKTIFIYFSLNIPKMERQNVDLKTDKCFH